MKPKLKRIAQKIVAIPLCMTILLCNIGMVIPIKLSNTQNNIQIEENISKEVNVIEIASRNDMNITSRSGYIRQEKIEYKIYEFNINQETILYFEDLDNANLQQEYLLNNTNNVEVEINEIIQDNKDNLSTEFEINNTIENYILKYKKPTTCFPTVSHKVTSTYGTRASRGDFHSGIDFSGSYGDNIYAYKSGTIIKVQYSNVSYGNMVLIQHENGIQTRYAHMSSISVKNGQYVECGQIVGYLGSTGNSTGNHLHFEVIINGNTVNPYNYIF